jgi:hypothetical protein
MSSALMSDIYPSTSLSDITSSYNSIKSTINNATSELNKHTTIGNLGDINEIVSEGMKQINDFIDNNKSTSTVHSLKNKALAVIDPKKKWAGKWLDNAKTELDKESVKEKTIDQIANQILDGINSQRERVIGYMETVVNIRNTLESSKIKYEDILPNAMSLVDSVAKDTREELDAKALVNRITKSIMQLDTTITNKIQPLIASAHFAIQEIDNQLPDIEHDLKYEGSLKVAQQSLSDLIGMAKTIKSMTEDAGDIIRKDIHETTLESIRMVGDVMLDTERMQRIQKEEQEHIAKVSAEFSKTKSKINQNFENMQQIHSSYISHKTDRSNLLLDSYTDKSNDS